MPSILDDPGVLQVVLEDFENHKLPRILLIKECVDCGDRLDEPQLEFLKEVHQEIHQYQSFVETHSEFRELYTDFVSLYCSIMDLALENEHC